jgi:hypothetical protein
MTHGGGWMRMVPFFIPRKTLNRPTNAALELKAHARTVLNADDETVVSVSERDCRDPGCRGAETIVLVLHPRRAAKAVKIEKPLEQISLSDLSDALAPLVAQTGLSEPPPPPR